MEWIILKKVKFIFSAVLILTIIGAVTCYFVKSDKIISGKGTEETGMEEIPQAVEPPRQEKIMLTAVGDILMHNTQIWSGEQPDGSYNFDTFFAPIKDYICKADFATTTFEAALNGPESGYTGYPLFNSPDEIATAIKEAGFDLVNLANNHILDRGYAGAVRTVEVFEKAGLKTIGTNKSLEDRSNYFIFNIRDVKVGYLAFTESTNGLTVPDEHSYFINYFDKEEILNHITRLRPQVDVLILILHWGVEYSLYPTDEQKVLAREFLEAGADAIIGSHPHVIQPIEYVNIDGKNKLIAYAIGNFIGDQRGVERNSGVILNMSFVKDFGTQETVLEEVTYIPTYSHSFYVNGRQKFEVVDIEASIEAMNNGRQTNLSSHELPLLQQALEQTKKQLGEFFINDKR